MNQWKKRLTALAAALTLVLPLTPASLGAESLTRGQARDALLTAADDYGTGEREILKGDENGELHLDRPLTRAEALVMLERAFGGFESPAGANARMAFSNKEFADVPAWAESELAGILTSGIVDRVGEEGLSPEATVTDEDLDTLVRRAYAYKGSQLKDDFYAAVNKEWLDRSTIPAGQMVNGALYGLMIEVNDQVAGLITDIAAQPQTPGTAEAKIAALYHTVVDTESREKAGVEPIRKYLDAIDSADSLTGLMETDADLREELGFVTLLSFGLTVDLMDSSRYSVLFGAFSPMLGKDFYEQEDPTLTEAYLTFLTRLFTLSGEEESAARADAQRIYDMEKAVSAVSLDPQDRGNVDLIYNLYTMEELKTIFPQVDLDGFYASSGLKPADRIGVSDVGAMEAAAAYFTEEHLDDLKAMSKMGLVLMTCAALSQDFLEAEYEFQAAYYGVEGRQSPEQIAAAQVQSLLSDYLSRAYAEEYFTPEAKADVEEMIGEFIAVYKERLAAQDWMSEETRAMALKKLDTMQVKVGYPESWETYLDNADIKGPEEGGSYFSNMISIQKAARAEMLSYQDKEVDKTQWVMAPYTVNACYNATANDITFPAAILQSPMYDVNASREENLGGIGYIIAHEITHAFDNNGAKFDENGNASDWWTREDYAAFQEKCQAVVNWYDGQESAPGIACSGMLTLSENVADLGALRCIVECAGKLEDPDYEVLFRTVAKTWASTAPRNTLEYLAVSDVHAADKLRVNRALQTIPQFYETFDIREGDGMWTAPEDRVSIW